MAFMTRLIGRVYGNHVYQIGLDEGFWSAWICSLHVVCEIHIMQVLLHVKSTKGEQRYKKILKNV